MPRIKPNVWIVLEQETLKAVKEAFAAKAIADTQPPPFNENFVAARGIEVKDAVLKVFADTLEKLRKKKSIAPLFE